MADISKIKLPSGSTYDIVDKKSGYKVVSINRKVDSGVNIADITIGDTTTQLYAPQGGGAGTVTSVGVSNATNGGLSVSGSPVTSSGTITIGHSNVLSSAQTTQAVYPIKIDKNGHISAYGSAVTVPSITLNGSSTTSPSFYAPTSVGTNGYVLKSNGSGAPTWAALSSSRNVFYTTCDTLANTTIKATTVTGFSFDEGNIIGVYFSTGNTNDEPRLKVNDTTKYIRIGNALSSGTGNVLKWSAGTLVYFVYDGTYFQYITSVSAASVEQPRGANVWYGTSSTGNGYPNKVATINNFVLTKGTIVAITFTKNSRVDDAAAFTLNINSTGAKAIYFQNAATSSSNVISWSEGQTLFFVYTGEYYYLLGKDEVNTDEKVLINNDSSSNITYYPVIASGGGSPKTVKVDTTGFKYTWFGGTTGSSDLELGNSIASGTTGNKQGRIKLYSSGTNYSVLSNDTLTETRVIKFPNKDGTIALTSDIPDVSGKIDTAGTGLSKSGTTLNHSNSVTAKTTQAVYPIKIDAQGHISAYGSAVTIPTKVSDLTNDSGFISTETDPTVPSWAKASTKPSYTASEVGAVPTSRTVNGKALSSNISLTASDVSAVPASDVTLSGEVSKIPKISSDGILEIRKYIDMHDTSSTLDYDVRLSATTSGTAGTGTLGIAAEEMQISINTSSTLYTDIVALGWNSDVIIT